MNSESETRKLWWLAPAGIISLGGVFFLGLSASYLAEYLSSSENPLRHELLEGAMLAVMMAIPFWILVSICSYFARRAISKSWLIALNLPMIVLCGCYAVALVVAVF